MKRVVENLKSKEYDVLVIGGGIHGATIAYETAKSGLSICLIEKDDFGSQTSANSLKVLHGGLRYLQHANFKRMRESIYSRKIFQKVAPHLVKSVPFVIPTNGFGVKSRFALTVAMKLNDLISIDRNIGIEDECRVPGGKTISKKEMVELAPGLNKNNITGGALWYESIAKNTERLLFEFLHSASANKAEMANYAEAVKYNFENKKISSVRVFDKINNEHFDIKSKIIVNSVGPWLNQILSNTQDLKLLKTPLTKAVNIIVKGKMFDKFAVGVESVREFKDKSALINKGKRLFFFVPLDNYTMIGTTYKVFSDHPNTCKIEEKDIIEIINEVNSAYNGLNIRLEDVTQTHVGTQAMPDTDFENEFDIQPETHSLIFDHSQKGNIDNLISVKSVKYTTAPAIAFRITNAIVNKLGKKSKNKSDIHLELTSKGAKENLKVNDAKYDEEILERFWNTYGFKAQEVIDFIEQHGSDEIIIEKEKILKGEVQYCIQKEMALTPEDIIDRRLGISALEKVSKDYYTKIEKVIDEYKNIKLQILK